MAHQSPTDFVFLLFLGLYLVAFSMISEPYSGAKSELPCAYEVDGFPKHIRLLFAYGRRTGINSSATDVRQDLLGM
jgi:hypothetical protein